MSKKDNKIQGTGFPPAQTGGNDRKKGKIKPLHLLQTVVSQGRRPDLWQDGPAPCFSLTPCLWGVQLVDLYGGSLLRPTGGLPFCMRYVGRCSIAEVPCWPFTQLFLAIGRRPHPARILFCTSEPDSGQQVFHIHGAELPVVRCLSYLFY